MINVYYELWADNPQSSTSPASSLRHPRHFRPNFIMMIQFNFVLFSFHFQFVWSERNWPVEDEMKARSFSSFLLPVDVDEKESANCFSISFFVSAHLRKCYEPWCFCWFMVTRRPLARFLFAWHAWKFFISRAVNRGWRSTTRLWGLSNEKLPIFRRLIPRFSAHRLVMMFSFSSRHVIGED